MLRIPRLPATGCQYCFRVLVVTQGSRPVLCYFTPSGFIVRPQYYDAYLIPSQKGAVYTVKGC